MGDKCEIVCRVLVFIAWVIGLIFLWIYHNFFSKVDDGTVELSLAAGVLYIFTVMTVVRCNKICTYGLGDNCKRGECCGTSNINPIFCYADYCCAVLTGAVFGFIVPFVCTTFIIVCATRTEDGGGKAMAGAGATVCVFSIFLHFYSWVKPCCSD